MNEPTNAEAVNAYAVKETGRKKLGVESCGESRKRRLRGFHAEKQEKVGDVEIKSEETDAAQNRAFRGTRPFILDKTGFLGKV